MTNTNNEFSMELIEQLRELTEEIDFNHFLKSSFGGYTKKSVLDYLSVLRKQQQTASETFYKNLQLLYAEKDELQNVNKKMQLRLQKLENDHQSLMDAVQLYHQENEELTISNLVSLKNQLNTNEGEMKKVKHEKSILESRLNHMETINEALKAEIKQSADEISAQKEFTKAIKQELKQKYNLIAELTNQLEVEREENKHLKARNNDSAVSQLKEKTNELMEQLTMQKELISAKTNESEQQKKIIEALQAETETLKENQDRLYAVINEINGQNDRLFLSNQELSKMLEAEFRNTILLVNEKSQINRDRIDTIKKLDEAYSRITMLEMQLEKGGKVIELNRISQQSEKLKSEQVK
jgi:DNA repair exonuclease SbcCD ATPase subunit